MPQTGWEHFHHVADIGVRGWGQSMAESFEQAALAMTAVITDLDTVKPVEQIEVTCAAPDDELLFVDWLNALVYEMAIRKMLFIKYKVTLENHCLIGQVWGEKIDIERHQPGVEIKGATYTELKVGQETDGSYMAQCVVDV